MTELEQSVQEAVAYGAAIADADSDEMPDFMHPLPRRDGNVAPFESGRVDRLKAESFQAMPSTPGLLVRALSVAEKYSDGKVTARMLKRVPSSPFEASSAFTQAPGIKIAYVLKGWATFEIEGLGETRIDTGTLICLPPQNRHRLLNTAPDFEDIEYEMPLLTASLSKTWSAAGPSCATSAMIDPETSESFTNIPNFLGAIERRFPIVQLMTGGAANVSVLRNNPPHIWDGTPWHVHHNNFFCSLFAKGNGAMGYEGFGDCALNTGDVFIQHGELRHREVLFSPDFETVKIELPGASPTTVLVYDKDKGSYKPMMFGSAQESAEAML